MRILLGIYLSICAISDIKWKKMIIAFSFIFGCVGIMYQISMKTEIIELMISSMVGISLIGISLMTKQKIGTLDGLVIMVCGLYLTIEEVLILCICSLFLAAMAGFIWLMIKRERLLLQKELSWIFFVWFVYFGMWIGKRG